MAASDVNSSLTEPRGRQCAMCYRVAEKYLYLQSKKSDIIDILK
jgi:hypothetical protein